MLEEIEGTGYVGEVVCWGTEYPLEAKGNIGITATLLYPYKGHRIKFKLIVLEDLGLDII
jgi:hypothetical protein